MEKKMEEERVHEDILFIKKMMEDNQRRLVDNGFSYIINGLVIAIGVPLSMVISFAGMDKYVPYLWIFLIVLMVALNLLIQKKVEKQKRIKTFGSEVFSAVWLACGLSIVILFVLTFPTSGMTSPTFMATCACILAIGYLLTGVINDFKFMKVLAGLWWLTAIILGVWKYFWELQFMSIFFAIMVFILQLIPATIIYKKWKKVNQKHAI